MKKNAGELSLFLTILMLGVSMTGVLIGNRLVTNQDRISSTSQADEIAIEDTFNVFTVVQKNIRSYVHAGGCYSLQPGKVVGHGPVYKDARLHCVQMGKKVHRSYKDCFTGKGCKLTIPFLGSQNPYYERTNAQVQYFLWEAQSICNPTSSKQDSCMMVSPIPPPATATPTKQAPTATTAPSRIPTFTPTNVPTSVPTPTTTPTPIPVSTATPTPKPNVKGIEGEVRVYSCMKPSDITIIYREPCTFGGAGRVCGPAFGFTDLSTQSSDHGHWYIGRDVDVQRRLYIYKYGFKISKSILTGEHLSKGDDMFLDGSVAYLDENKRESYLSQEWYDSLIVPSEDISFEIETGSRNCFN